MTGILIGGEELAKLICVVDPNSRPDSSKICLEVDRDHLHLGAPIRRDDQAIQHALDVIRSDLATKMKHRDGFVSIRLHIGNEVLRMPASDKTLNIGNEFENLKEFFLSEESSPDNGLRLKAGEFAVFRSLERVSLPADVAAFVQTRTTIAFVGLDVTPTNQIVPGFRDGILFLEVHNRAPLDIIVPRYAALAEIFFLRTGGSFSGEAQTYHQLQKEMKEDTSDGNVVLDIIDPTIEILYEPLLTSVSIAAGVFLWRVIEHRIVSDATYIVFGCAMVVLIAINRYLMKSRTRIQRLLRTVRWPWKKANGPG